MSGPVTIIFALCGLAMMLYCTGRLLFPEAPASTPPSVHLTAWFAVGVIFILVTGGIVSVVHPKPEEVQLGGGLFALMLAGMLAKWLWDASLHKPFRLEGTPLMQSFVVAPLIVTATWGTLKGGPTLHTSLLCFSNGFFWQTIFSDLAKKRGRNP